MKGHLNRIQTALTVWSRSGSVEALESLATVRRQIAELERDRVQLRSKLMKECASLRRQITKIERQNMALLVKSALELNQDVP